MILLKKISTRCCDREDAIVWIGGMWLGMFPTQLYISHLIGETVGVMGLEAFSMFCMVQAIFEVPRAWFYICFLAFFINVYMVA